MTEKKFYWVDKLHSNSERLKGVFMLQETKILL